MKKGRQPRPLRLTIRLPERLYAGLLPLAIADSRYLADWIVVTLEHAITRYDVDQPLARLKPDGTLRWVKETGDHRLTLRVAVTLHRALVTVAKHEHVSISKLVTAILENEVALKTVI